MPMLEAAKPKKRATKQSNYPRLWTADEFLAWLQPDRRADLIAGQKFMHSPASLRHATLLNTVDALLRSYLAEKDLGSLYREVIALKFSDRYVFEPDMMYFTKEQDAQLLSSYAQLVPVLVVEALSKRTAKRDVGIKFAAYEQFGVQEYWILDPLKSEHRFYAREGGLLVEFAQDEEKIESKSIPGFYLRRQWLTSVNPPSFLACYKEIMQVA